MEVRQTRYAEIKLIKYDSPEVNIRFTGRSSSMVAADGDKVWQIGLEYRTGDITKTTYANKGEFNCSWTDRASYFDPTVPNANEPLGGTIAVTGNFSFSPSGLRNAGRISLVTLNTATWTPLPAVPLTDRNGISVQNQTAIQIKLNYDPLVAGYIGPSVETNGERFYDIKDTIILYGKSQSGNPIILIEEIS